MVDSEAGNLPVVERKPIDWRGWIVLGWVVWFGLLYGKMVLAERGEKIRSMISILKR